MLYFILELQMKPRLPLRTGQLKLIKEISNVKLYELAGEEVKMSNISRDSILIDSDALMLKTSVSLPQSAQYVEFLCQLETIFTFFILARMKFPPTMPFQAAPV